MAIDNQTLGHSAWNLTTDGPWTSRATTLDVSHMTHPSNDHWANSSNHGNFFNHLKVTEESLFIGLIALGVIVPVLFVGIFAVVCYRRQKAIKTRRAERLLRNAQEMALDDYPPVIHKLQSLTI